MRIFAKGIVADTLTLQCGGTEVLKVEYKFNADAHWTEIMKLRLDLARAMERKHPDYQLIGEKVTDMFVLVFGKECSQKMLDFFDGHLETMIKNISPVFQYKIYPACEKARKREIKARKNAK